MVDAIRLGRALVRSAGPALCSPILEMTRSKRIDVALLLATFSSLRGNFGVWDFLLLSLFVPWLSLASKSSDQ